VATQRTATLSSAAKIEMTLANPTLSASSSTSPIHQVTCESEPLWPPSKMVALLP
jgi:hypothetical protein